MTTTVKINMGGDETARRRCRAAQRATPRAWSAITQEEVIEKSAQLSWLARIRFVRQICRPDGRPGELVNDTLLEGHKTGCLQETVVVQIRQNAVNVIDKQDMPTELLGKSVLDIDNVVLPVQLAGNKKRRGREHDLIFDHAIGVAQTDILLALVLNRKSLDIA